MWVGRTLSERVSGAATGGIERELQLRYVLSVIYLRVFARGLRVAAI